MSFRNVILLDHPVIQTKLTELRDFSAYNFRVLPVHEGVVLVTYDCVIHMPEGDPPGMAPRYQHLSDVWVREADEWRLRFQQATAARPID